MNRRTTKGSIGSFLLCMALLLAATGCTAMSDTSEFHAQQSAAEAKIQLAAWITPGTPLADAARKLTSQGFICEAAMPQSPDVRSSVYCIYQTPPQLPPEQRVVAPLTPVTWIVILDSKDGATISNFQASRSPLDP